MKITVRFVCLLLALALLGGLAPVASAAESSGTLEGSDIRWSVDLSTGVLTLSGSGKMPYTQLSHPWERYKEQIKKAVIQNGITNVGNYAFYDCHAMTEVVIPDSVTEIDSSAFVFCSSLASVRLPKTLTCLGDYAFDNCTALKAIDIPGGVKKIALWPFRGCGSLTSVTLHEGLEEIGENAFHGLPISSITIPATVKTVGQSAFENCASLTEVRFSEGLEGLASRSFAGTGLRTVTLPASLKYVSDDAFSFTELDKVVVLGRKLKYNSNFAGSTYGYALVYAYPGSTTETLWKNSASFTFQPLYFADVQPSAWYYDAVRYAKENDLFNGTSDTAFSPGNPMNRAMAVTVLYRYAKLLSQPSAEPEPSDAFADVPAGTWYSEAVAWAAANGIVTGVGEGRFNPKGALTREQLVAILYRFAQWLGDDVTSEGTLDSFADADRVGGYARDAAVWATENGIVTGVGENRFNPKGSATRAQVATILMRYIENVRGAAHPQLYVYADAAELPILTRAAEEYGKEHPELTIRIGQTDPKSFGRDYLLDGRRDLFLAADDNACMQIRGRYVSDNEQLVAYPRRLHLAVASGDPQGVGTAKNLLAMLRAKTGTVAYSQADYRTQSYGEPVLQASGCSYSELQSLPTAQLASNKEVAAALADGTATAGVFWDAEIREYGLTALPDVSFSTEYSYHGDAYSFLPVSSARYAKAHAFAEWIAEHPELFEE